jgi:cellulose synthase/poly-beta-1,6-N-acetylglucosamine synthase-like glycosyltransferase
MATLDIYITSVPSRQHKLSHLLSVLTPQIVRGVRVVVDLSLETFFIKLNRATTVSTADYLVFIDDDDMVHTDYIATIMPYLNDSIDYLSYGIDFWIDGLPQPPLTATSDNQTPYVNPRCPIRTSLTIGLVAKDSYTAEMDWSRQLSKRITNFAEIPRSLLDYRYDSNDNYLTLIETIHNGTTQQNL